MGLRNKAAQVPFNGIENMAVGVLLTQHVGGAVPLGCKVPPEREIECPGLCEIMKRCWAERGSRPLADQLVTEITALQLGGP